MNNSLICEINTSYLTEFVGYSGSYGLRFFHFNLCDELKWKNRGAVTYSTDRENEVSKMFNISFGNRPFYSFVLSCLAFE